MNSFVFNMVATNSYTVKKSVFKVLKKDFKYIIMPCNIPQHWFLAVINRNGTFMEQSCYSSPPSHLPPLPSPPPHPTQVIDIHDRSVSVYDSFYNEIQGNALHVIRCSLAYFVLIN